MWNDMKMDEYSDEDIISKIKGKKVIIYGASSRIKKHVEGCLKNRISYIVDSDDTKEGTRMFALDIHSLRYLEKEPEKENIVVMSVLKCVSLIEYNLNKIGIKEWYYEKYRGIGTHLDYDKYKEYKKKHSFEEHNKKIIGRNKTYDFVDFIYDGKFVKNVCEIIKQHSDFEKHLVIVHCLDYLNENDQNNMWDYYISLDNVIVIDDIYEGVTLELQLYLEKVLCQSKGIVFHSGVISKKMSRLLHSVLPKGRGKMRCILHGAELNYTHNSEFYSDIVSICDKVTVGFARERAIAVYGLDEQQIDDRQLDYSEALIINSGTAHETVNVLLGFSATQLCDHLYGISLLKKYKYNAISVYCPLNYSVESVGYVQKIISYGKQELGEKFIPILDFIDLEKYGQFLSNIDIALFPNLDKCGWTTISALCRAHKKIFCSDTMMPMIQKHNYTAHKMTELQEMSFEEFSSNDDEISDREWNSGWKDIYEK